uniref:NAD(P)H dehydrogenase (quinone) n=3 Tax=Opuntia streptacantha TaxID=393608 RepID=A0A7C9ARY5_OPUST
MAGKLEGDRVIKVAAICGSLRRASKNRGILRAAMKMCAEGEVEGMEMEHIDISVLPMINMDMVVDGKYPPIVEEFRSKIRAADAVFFASPEYNYSVSPLLKNALDWASRAPNAWGDKAAAIVSVEGSGKCGQYHLRQIGVFLDLHFINKPEFFLNGVEPPSKFDNNGDLIDEAVRLKLKQLLLSLHAFATRLIKGKC